MSQSQYRLFGCKGCGSAVVEAMLELHDIPFDYVEVEPWDAGPAADELRHHNPLKQVPTLVAGDAGVVTESAAIVLWLLGQHPESIYLPRDPAARAAVYRWTVFIAANIYAAIGIGDFPARWVEGEAAHQSLKEKTVERSLAYWKMLEDSVRPAPFLLGDAMSALDVYAALVSRWRPGRKAIAEACPKLAAAFARTEQHPIVARVWGRNFAESSPE